MLESLNTERLLLRPVDIGDADFMARLYGNADVMAHIGMGVQTPAEARRMLFAKAGTYALLGLGNWTVCTLDDGVAIGEFGFFDAGRGSELGVVNALEAGWSFLPRAWGCGLATEACRAAHDWFDRHFAGRESFVLISPANEASLQVARNCGYGTGEPVEYQGRANQLLRRAVLSTA